MPFLVLAKPQRLRVHAFQADDVTHSLIFISSPLFLLLLLLLLSPSHSLSLSLSPSPSLPPPSLFASQELLYTHNAYPIISKNPALLRSMLSNVWNQLITMEDLKGLHNQELSVTAVGMPFLLFARQTLLHTTCVHSLWQ